MVLVLILKSIYLMNTPSPVLLLATLPMWGIFRNLHSPIWSCSHGPKKICCSSNCRCNWVGDLSRWPDLNRRPTLYESVLEPSRCNGFLVRHWLLALTCLRPYSSASVIWRKSESSALTNLQQLFRLLQCLASHPKTGSRLTSSCQAISLSLYASTRLNSSGPSLIALY